jgi:amino acid adenylation domain-containing protein
MRRFVHDFLTETAAKQPDQVALIVDGRGVTYSELDRASDNFARALQGRGVVRGDRVALFLDNSYELVAGVFGALKAGAVFVIVNPTTRRDKLHYLLDDSGARAVVAHGRLASTADAALVDSPSVEHVWWVDRDDPGPPEVNSDLEPVLGATDPPPDDPGLIDNDLCGIIYTSGSTGDPKGVMLTHRNMVNTAWSISTYLENTPDDVVLCVLPLSFDYGLYQVITGARVGFTVVLERSFAFPWRTLQLMAEHGVTGLPGVPTLFATVLQLAPFEGLDLSGVRYMSNTAASFPPAHIRRLQELFPAARIFSMYGLTECTRVSYLDPDLLPEKADSVGKAIPNCEMYVLDEDGRRAPPGVAGELMVRGANVMRGYWRKPEATARRLVEGEIAGELVLRTGDLFQMDAEGFFYFVGRMDDVFKCRGEKISPRESPVCPGWCRRGCSRRCARSH